MKTSLRQKMEGDIVKVQPDPHEPEEWAWVDVAVGEEILRLLVTQSFSKKHNLTEKKTFSWLVWKQPWLNFFLSPVQEIKRSSKSV